MTLQKDVFDKIKKSIIYGELGPGEKISEVALAMAMKVSRTPVREAIRKLQMEGYATIVPNKGAHVRKLPLKETEEIYNLIGLLEGYAAELAARRINNSELNKLKKLQRELFLLGSKKMYFNYTEKNTEFHFLIARLSGNSNLERFITELRTRIFRYRLIVTVPGSLERYASDHTRIIDAISRHDSIHARKFMEEHVKFVKEHLISLVNEKIGF